MSDPLRRHAKKLGYPDHLVDPIVLPIRNPKGGTFNIYSERVWFEQEATKKLGPLLNQYGLHDDSPTSMRRLVMRLAEDWVPGFAAVRTPRRARGAPKKHDAAALLEFLAKIEAIVKADKAKRKNKLTPACREFQKQQKRGTAWKYQTEKWLADLYRNTKKIETSLRSEVSTMDSAAYPTDFQAVIRSLSQLLAPGPVKKK